MSSIKPVIKKINSGKYLYKYLGYQYEIINHGYYPPDKCIWWEAVDVSTGCADFHETTKMDLINLITKELNEENDKRTIN